MDDFPSNRQTRPVREEGPAKHEEPKQVRRVVEGEVIRRKKSHLKRFRDLFVGDGRSVRDMILEDIIVPGFRDVAFDAFQTGLEGVFYRGDNRPRRGRPGQRGVNVGHVAYNRMSPDPRDRRRHDDPRDLRRDLSPRGRANHNFDEIILPTRVEADEALSQMYDLLERYDAVTVADLYTIVGISSTPIDLKWGWTDLFNSGVTRTRGGGYLLDLPTPEYLKD